MAVDIPDKAHRIAVFTGAPSYSVCKGIAAIETARPGAQWLVLVHAPPRRVGRLLRNQWRNLKRNGWRWIPYQLGEILEQLLTLGAPAPAPDAPGGTFSLSGLQGRLDLEVRYLPNINSDAGAEALRKFAPDLGLSLAAPFLRDPIFSLPRCGTLNLHKGKVPDYRGMPPAFWELWHDEQQVGCTVHAVAAGLDTGDIVAETVVARSRYSSLRGLQLQLDETGVELMRDAALATLDGNAQPEAQAAGGNTFRKPTLLQTAALQKKLAAVEPAAGSAARQRLKDTVATAVFKAWRAGGAYLAPPRITVLLYHRVTDDVRDNLTVGIAQFERQMRLIRRHCTVLSLTQVLAGDAIPRSRRPLVAVSFDDGYLDNFSNAAPILQRHRIPAAFFVTTGIVATNRQFPHDQRRENPPIPMMDWEQVRAMHESGFFVGSHTVNHIDCVAEPEDVVRRELAQSRQELAERAGIHDPVFAYPSGGRHQMNAQRLELVKAAGYPACLAAYGGTNLHRVDPYNVQRRGIHWEFSDRAFLLECLGLT